MYYKAAGDLRGAAVVGLYYKGDIEDACLTVGMIYRGRGIGIQIVGGCAVTKSQNQRAIYPPPPRVEASVNTTVSPWHPGVVKLNRASGAG